MFLRVRCEHLSSVDVEQVARNDAVFRAANERIERAGLEANAPEPLPFICECADLACRQLVALTQAEYEGVRRHSTRFLVAPGHEGAANGAARVVEQGSAYVVVELVGEAADVADALDPRKGR
jgi:hypothetical protein